MNEKISAVVLAGGQGSRMGFRDKGLILLDGKPLFLHVIERIAPFCDEIMVSANRNLDEYRQAGFAVHADSGESQGPLSGVLCALQMAKNPLLLVVACDSPFLPADLLPRLLAALMDNDADVAVAASNGRIHHATMLCRTTLLPSLTQYLAAGNSSIRAWQQGLRQAAVEFDDAHAFCNLNTPEDIAAISLSGGKP